MFYIRGRKLWGARKPSSAPTRDNWKQGVTLVLHHTADHGPASLSVRNKNRYLQGIQTFHQRNRGWADIGYNYLIFPDGTVYEGRGFGVRGAHVAGHNTDSCGITFVGTYTSAEPSDKAVKAYANLRQRLTKHGAKIIGTKAHSDYMATACPGSGIRKHVMGRSK